MLIINADDWGRSAAETDAALACHARGAVTSVSAMMFMSDSERAATLAKENKIDVGLHLNLIESYSGPNIPAAFRGNHERVARFLRRSKYSLLLYHPFLRAAFREIYEAQAAEFLRLYGHPPSHIDGHLHMHLCSNVLLDGILPAGQKVRRSFSFGPGEKSGFNRAYRQFVDRRLARRHRLTDYFFTIPTSLDSERMVRAARLAKTDNVELMTHPFYPAEYAFLLSAGFLDLLRSLPTGSYADL